jgi:hypothetical protein
MREDWAKMSASLKEVLVSCYAGALVVWVKELLPRRGLKPGVVERTFGWFSKFRRSSKDYEYRTDNSETSSSSPPPA